MAALQAVSDPAFRQRPGWQQPGSSHQLRLCQAGRDAGAGAGNLPLGFLLLRLASHVRLAESRGKRERKKKKLQEVKEKKS